MICIYFSARRYVAIIRHPHVSLAHDSTRRLKMFSVGFTGVPEDHSILEAMAVAAGGTFSHSSLRNASTDLTTTFTSVSNTLSTTRDTITSLREARGPRTLRKVDVAKPSAFEGADLQAQVCCYANAIRDPE